MRDDKIQDLIAFLAEHNEPDHIRTVTEMRSRGLLARAKLAYKSGEPCHGDCWFSGQCPRVPVCNE